MAGWFKLNDTLLINDASEVVVFAYGPANGNTGVDKTTFIVTE